MELSACFSRVFVRTEAGVLDVRQLGLALVPLFLLWYSVREIVLTYAVLGALFMPLLALTLTHQGDIARHNQDYVLALNLYREALRIDQAKKNRAGMAVRWRQSGQMIWPRWSSGKS